MNTKPDYIKPVIDIIDNCTTIINLVPDKDYYSDSTEVKPRDAGALLFFMPNCEVKVLGTLNGVEIEQRILTFNEEQLKELTRLSKLVDVVLVTEDVIEALNTVGKRHLYENVLSYRRNFTRSDDDAVIDTGVWIY